MNAQVSNAAIAAATPLPAMQQVTDPAGSVARVLDAMVDNGPYGDDSYALEISGNSMEPAYRDGTVILVSPTATVRPGNRVVVKTRDGEVMAQELRRRTSKSIDLRSLNPQHTERSLSVDDVLWIARIMWASQ